MMSNRTVTRVLLIAFGIGGATAMAASAPAHADPLDNYISATSSAVCETLDDFPTFSGIEGIGVEIVQDTGWTFEEAGAVVERSIVAECPRHAALWNRFVATYGTNNDSQIHTATGGTTI